MPEAPKLVSTERLYPCSRAQRSRHAYLSVLDSSVANYTTCGAVFLFPHGPALPTTASSSSQCVPPAYSEANLRRSLRTVLDTYPQWAGTLRLVDYDPEIAQRDHRRRFGRVELLWAREDDPGVELAFHHRTGSIESIRPVTFGEEKVRNGKFVDRNLFIPSASLVRLRSPTDPTLPAMAIRVTRFEDGVAIGVGLHHSLADATTLMQFMKDWSAIHRSFLLSGSFPPLQRAFEPHRLDAYASPGIDDQQENRIAKARALEIPQLRYDFWASNGGRPPIISTPGHPDPAIAHLDDGEGNSRGRLIPWETWDWQAPVVDYILHFTPSHIHRIYSHVYPSGAPSSISRLDALLGHLWRLITQARQIPSTETVHLDMSLGLRARLDPPLPDDFLGCPLTNISPSLLVSQLSESVLSGASAIRDAIQIATPRLPDLLHHEAHALDPIREWNAFMGSRHLMVTSWLGVGADEVYFAEEAKGNGWVHADMWPIDGLMVLMDASSAPKSHHVTGSAVTDADPTSRTLSSSSEDPPHRSQKPSERQRRWYEDGVVVRLVVQEEVMGRLLADPELWPEGA